GRAIVRHPDVFLFDEPLSNLDAELRVHMRVEIAKLHKTLKTTVIYVTHDQVEAMTLADRIVILNNGRIEQEGPPLHLYQHPENRFVAGFLGQPKMNFVPVVADGANLRLGAGGPVLLTRPVAAGQAVELGIRPDAISLAGGGIPARIVLVERLGGSSLLHTKVEGLDTLLTVELPGTYEAATGTQVHLAIDPARAHVFASTGQTL
ncbi:MAG: TOBE domain-containing protein, partial [Alphaproteobacteria bacterium]